MKIQTFSPPRPDLESARKKLKKPRKRFILLAFFLALLFFILATGLTALNVKDKLESGQNRLQAALELAGNSQDNSENIEVLLERFEAALEDAREDFTEARDSLAPLAFLLEGTGWLPGPFYDSSRLPALLEMALNGTEVGLELVRLAKPLWQAYSPSGSMLEKVARVGNTLQEPDNQRRLAYARAYLTQVGQARQNIQLEKITIPRLKKLLEDFDRAFPQLTKGLLAAQTTPAILPDLLGTPDKPRKYLVLAQNSDELRPTGGFISSVGLIELDGKRLKVLDFKDSYQVGNRPYFPPPPALSDIMQAGALVLRDANWWPDFPTSARMVQTLYTGDTGIIVDGVLALDMQAVTYLFEGLGSLDLPKYGEKLTARNFQERIRYYYQLPGQATNGEWWLKRKEFMGDLFRGLLGKLENGGGLATTLRLTTALDKTFAEKHLLLYATNDTTQAELTRLGFDGGLGSNWVGDFLMVVDSNTGFNKVNPKIQQEISYRVEKPATGGKWTGWRKATLTIAYTNTAPGREDDPPQGCRMEARYGSSYESMIAGCYQNYLRVYTPEGSWLEEEEGFSRKAETLNEAGRNVFAGQFILEPGHSTVIRLTYWLPPAVESNGTYRLLVQKQPGTLATPLKLNLEERTFWQGKLISDWNNLTVYR
jgi:hypothetical protein